MDTDNHPCGQSPSDVTRRAPAAFLLTLTSVPVPSLLNRNTSNITQSKPPEQPQRNSSQGRVEQWVNSPPKLTFPYPGLPKTGFSMETSADQQPQWSLPATSSSKSLSQKQRPTYLQSKYSRFDVYTICWLEQLRSHFRM